MRYTLLGLAITVAAFFHITHALALDGPAVAAVTEILEELAPERGESVYYDDQAAADWLEFDEESSGLIAAAGFSPQAWRAAYDSTLKGLIALIPQDEFDAVQAGAEEKIVAVPGLTDEQKREMIADWRTHAEQLRALRAEGAAYARTVQPFEARLRTLADF